MFLNTLRNWKLSTGLAALGLLALGTIVPAASARPPVVVFHGGFYGGGFWGPGPYYYGYGPAFAYGYYTAPNAGKIKIDTKLKDAIVYVDGGYAGSVRQLGTFPLRTGTHNIELRAPDGHSFFQQTVNVIPGKTTKLFPDYR